MAELKMLFIEELQRLLDVEYRLVTALAKMSRAANAPKLREGFQKHLSQTEEHANRLHQIFKSLGVAPQAMPSKAIAGLISEGEEIIESQNQREPWATDLALIAAAQKVEHHEISAYGTARVLARQLGELQIASLLSQTLGDEEATDYLLSELAKPLIQDATLKEREVVAA